MNLRLDQGMVFKSNEDSYYDLKYVARKVAFGSSRLLGSRVYGFSRRPSFWDPA